MQKGEGSFKMANTITKLVAGVVFCLGLALLSCGGGGDEKAYAVDIANSIELVEVIDGEWLIENYNQEELFVSTGHLEIYPDSTYRLISGSFAAIGLASEGGCSSQNPDDPTYQIYTEELMSFQFSNTSSIPRLVKLEEDLIIFVGSGGCGLVGRQRISVLTRIR